MSKDTPTQNQFTNSELKQIEKMAKYCPYYNNGKCHSTDNEAVDRDLMCNMFGFMANLENAGYRKQVEGEWGFDGMSWTCSECDEYATKGIKTNFCPNCGARMKGENNE